MDSSEVQDPLIQADQVAQGNLLDQASLAAASSAINPVAGPLLAWPSGCETAFFLRRHKRFCVEVWLDGREVWVHSNNSGSMLGLTRPGSRVLLSPATNPSRKLKYTQECASLLENASPCAVAVSTKPAKQGPGDSWVGVNTSVPNRMLEAAFHAGRLDFARGYTMLTREAKRGQSRLDACLRGPEVLPDRQNAVPPEGAATIQCTAQSDTQRTLPLLWVECKNVTLVEDEVALFPDAATERGQKHLRELMDIVASGERAAMFYLVQRADGQCFAPADCIDPLYAELFYTALERGVEVYPYRAVIDERGIDLGDLLPIRRKY